MLHFIKLFGQSWPVKPIKCFNCDKLTWARWPLLSVCQNCTVMKLETFRKLLTTGLSRKTLSFQERPAVFFF